MRNCIQIIGHCTNKWPFKNERS